MNPASETEEAELFVDPSDDRPLVARRSLDDNEMDITPMIDITFLLLIFFLVAGRMGEGKPIELPSARHGTAVSAKTSVVVTVAAGDDKQVLVYLGDGKAPDRLVDAADLVAQEAAIESYVEEELANSQGSKNNVVIKAERNVKHREVARITAAVAKAGSDLYVAVMEMP